MNRYFVNLIGERAETLRLLAEARGRETGAVFADAEIAEKAGAEAAYRARASVRVVEVPMPRSSVAGLCG